MSLSLFLFRSEPQTGQPSTLSASARWTEQGVTVTGRDRAACAHLDRLLSSDFDGPVEFGGDYTHYERGTKEAFLAVGQFVRRTTSWLVVFQKAVAGVVETHRALTKRESVLNAKTFMGFQAGSAQVRRLLENRAGHSFAWEKARNLFEADKEVRQYSLNQAAKFGCTWEWFRIERLKAREPQSMSAPEAFYVEPSPLSPPAFSQSWSGLSDLPPIGGTELQPTPASGSLVPTSRLKAMTATEVHLHA